MQQEEIEQLQRSLSNQEGQTVELIATHASWVLLTTAFAYKIKKPVKYSFLDFSTLENRKHYCSEELRLNRRLTPDMYLGIVPVIRQGNSLRLGNNQEGAVVDYALKMRRMDHNRQMDLLLAKDAVTPDQVRAIAHLVADFHKRAERVTGIIDADDLKEKFNDVLVIVPLLQELFGREAVKTLEEACRLSDQFIDTYLDRQLEREKAGWTIDGHGDLHSKNIFLLDKPVIFDCIEFEATFRQFDVLNEIAFFCMDLDYFGKHELVAHFVDAYLAEIPCIESNADWQLFHYYKLYRANIRLKVNGLAAMQATPETRDPGLVAEVKKYLDLFHSYLQALR